MDLTSVSKPDYLPTKAISIEGQYFVVSYIRALTMEALPLPQPKKCPIGIPEFAYKATRGG